MTGRLFSPGKLLLTAEYTVLDGALALAVPTKLGQELHYDEIEDGKSLVLWNAYHGEKLWLSAEISYLEWQITDSNLAEPAEFVLKTLRNVAGLTSSKFKRNTSYHFKSVLQFPADFGLGSSSTLMNNLAEWASIDPFILNERSLGGSGYDIAVAREKSALLYQKSSAGPRFRHVNFDPPFRNELLFIHLNKKQNSREGIEQYKKLKVSKEAITVFSDLTIEVAGSEDIDSFSALMEAHEQKMSDLLQLETVKQKFFEDCPVFLKSLGAWGGDFIMSRKFEGYEDYFRQRGFTTIFGWQDIIR